MCWFRRSLILRVSFPRMLQNFVDSVASARGDPLLVRSWVSGIPVVLPAWLCSRCRSRLRALPLGHCEICRFFFLTCVERVCGVVIFPPLPCCFKRHSRFFSDVLSESWILNFKHEKRRGGKWTPRGENRDNFGAILCNFHQALVL